MPHVYVSRYVAKVEVCRDALDQLRAQFPQWVVPRAPDECHVDDSPGEDEAAEVWVDLLQSKEGTLPRSKIKGRDEWR